MEHHFHELTLAQLCVIFGIMVVWYNFCDVRSQDAAIIMWITNKITFVMVMKLTPNLEETTVQGIDMKCFLIGSSVMCFCHLTF